MGSGAGFSKPAPAASYHIQALKVDSRFFQHGGSGWENTADFIDGLFMSLIHEGLEGLAALAFTSKSRLTKLIQHVYPPPFINGVQ